ncbi:MAG: pyridoxal-dependent decarboxylase [Thermodesulfobacteriota bacterium]|nr:pyridoxal-dependent decarboxylase [Thermodesulfobacteriota bacterium]
MGSTEGNIYGLWNARDYLAGRKLIVDKKKEKNKFGQFRQRYLKPDIKEEDLEQAEIAYTPVAFYSQDTHYSIIKAMRVLGIETFHNIGSTKYKDQNPLEPETCSWDGYEEVPSEGVDEGPGSIDIKALATLVEFFAEKGYPILINLNYGSTFKGAYDDVESIQDRLIPIFQKDGLVNRKVYYNKDEGKFDYRDGYWIHVDGALGAAYMPFLELANKHDKSVRRGPNFDFRLPAINSLVMSGHKWPGAPWPCGIFMTKVKYQITPPDDPKYLGSPDSTFAGSRNVFTPVILWDYLAKHSYEKQKELALGCEKMAQYAYEQLFTVKDAHPDIDDLYVDRTPLALTVRFRKPNKDIIFKYSLSCESLEHKTKDDEGKDVVEERHYAHMFAMMSTTKQNIDDLVHYLKQPDAFKADDEEPMAFQMKSAWR